MDSLALSRFTACRSAEAPPSPIYSLQIGGGPSIAYQWNEAVHSPDVQTLTVSTTVGATLLFSYQLDVGTYTFDSTGYPIPYNSYDVNFLDTPSLFIDPQSPSNPTPERKWLQLCLACQLVGGSRAVFMDSHGSLARVGLPIRPPAPPRLTEPETGRPFGLTPARL